MFVEAAPSDLSFDVDVAAGDAAVLLTVIEGPEIGQRLLVGSEPGVRGGDARPALAAIADRVEDSGILCWRGQRVFAEVFRPAQRLVIVGAIDIAEALAHLANALGWRTICIDPRAVFASSERVPSASELLVEWPDQALRALDVDEDTAIVVLLHDEKFIVPTLLSALEAPASYIGVLGSRHAQAAWHSQLIAAGVPRQELVRLHGPAGLDIGASTPIEVAVAVFAEILAVRSGRRGGFLRDGRGAITRRPLSVAVPAKEIAPVHRATR